MFLTQYKWIFYTLNYRAVFLKSTTKQLFKDVFHQKRFVN